MVYVCCHLAVIVCMCSAARRAQSGRKRKTLHGAAADSQQAKASRQASEYARICMLSPL